MTKKHDSHALQDGLGKAALSIEKDDSQGILLPRQAPWAYVCTYGGMPEKHSAKNISPSSMLELILRA